MAEKMKACQYKSTNISTDDEIQNILVKNPEKDIDISFVQELSADKLVENNHYFADFKKICIGSIC